MSLFNPRNAVPDSEDIMARFEAESRAFRSQWPHCHLDRLYGEGERQTYDLFLPSPQQRLEGFQIFVHGGFWCSRHKDHFSFMARGFVQSGWAYAVMTYPLLPAVSFNHLVDQTARGVAQVAADLREISRSLPLVVSGHSAGAHLLAMAFHSSRGGPHIKTMSGLPERLVLVSGAYDTQACLLLEMFSRFGLTPADAKANSPFEDCHPSGIKTLLFAGAREPIAWREQGERYVQTLAKAGLDIDSQKLLAGHDHFSILEAMANPASELACAMRLA